MYRIARIGLSWVLFFFLFLLPASVLSETKKVDPHGKPGMCRYCHTSNVAANAEGGFRKNTVEAACLQCHGKKGASLKEYLQKMLPKVKIKEKLVNYFGKHKDFSCHSCHNAMAPRKSPKKDLLFRNPHIQLGKDGEISEKACLFCHTELPDYKNPGVANAKMRYDLNYLCSLCHIMSSTKRGLGMGRRLSDARVRRKEQFEKKHDVSLPLGPNNTVVCASCHNPHQPGVVLGKNGATVPSEHRLALKDIWLMCSACHMGDY